MIIKPKDPQPIHSCSLCTSPEYAKAVAVLQRSGLKEEKWGYMLHDMVATLVKNEQYQIAEAA